MPDQVRTLYEYHHLSMIYLSDKDVLSCVPTMEWVALAECESNETHSTTCGFTATSKVLSYGQDSVDVSL